MVLYNAVANEGVLLKPPICKIYQKGDEVIKTYEPRVLNPSICSPTTLEDLKQMLEG